MWWASTKEQCELIQLLDKRGASRDYSSRPGFKSDISSGISCTEVPIEPRPKGAGFRGFRPFVFVERSIGNSRGNRMCCDHIGQCSASNGCPCAKKNSCWEPYDKEGRLNASEREHESKIIYEVSGVGRESESKSERESESENESECESEIESKRKSAKKYCRCRRLL
jgi:hypothetical protein